MSDTEMADLVGRLVVGTNGVVPPLSEPDRTALERFARRLMVYPPGQQEFIRLREEAFDRLGVAHTDTPEFRTETDEYAEALAYRGVGALSDRQLVGLVSDNADMLETMSDLVIEALESADAAPDWSDAFGEVLHLYTAKSPEEFDASARRHVALARALSQQQ